MHWTTDSRGAQGVPLGLGNDADIRHKSEDGNKEVTWESGERYEKNPLPGEIRLCWNIMLPK